MQRTAAEARPSALIFTNPAVPMTLEGASVLHQMMRLRWKDWKALPAAQRSEIAREAAATLAGAAVSPMRVKALCIRCWATRATSCLFISGAASSN